LRFEHEGKVQQEEIPTLISVGTDRYFVEFNLAESSFRNLKVKVSLQRDSCFRKRPKLKNGETLQE
jgi:hypothetical protein